MPRFKIKLFVESSSFEVEADTLDEAIEKVGDDPYVAELRKYCEEDYRLDGEEIDIDNDV